MKERILLGSVIVYTVLSRFWFIGKFPILITSSSLPFRFLTAFLSVLGVVFLYWYTKAVFGDKKIAVLSAFFLGSLPWSFEQGRIASPPSNAIAILLLLLFAASQKRQLFFKIILYGCIPLILFFFYPQFWLFRTNLNSFSNIHVLQNLFILLSPDLLFFHNITFWWGGVREAGVLYFSLIPFFLIGIYQLIFSANYCNINI